MICGSKLPDWIREEYIDMWEQQSDEFIELLDKRSRIKRVRDYERFDQY